MDRYHPENGISTQVKAAFRSPTYITISGGQYTSISLPSEPRCFVIGEVVKRL
jgi:hypothetical protein